MKTKTNLIKLLVVVIIPIALWNIPAPEGLEVDTWRLVAVYLGLLSGLVLKPYSEPIITTIIYPIFRQIAEGAGSKLDENPRKLGTQKPTEIMKMEGQHICR